MGKASVKGALPVGVILTHSAAGSEMSNSAVVTNMELNLKKGISTEFNRCKFAICNPELTYSVSKYQTACGIVDMMTHTIERYFTVCEDTPLTDGIAEALLRSIIDAGRIAVKNPTDYNARATLMWGSSLAHNGLTSCGRENYLAVHQLEHAVSGVFDEVAHGAGLAVLYPAWAKFIYKYNVKRFARIARNVWDVVEDNDEICALKGIEKMQEFFAKIGMPTRLKDFNIDETYIDKFVEICTAKGQRTVKSYIPLGEKEIAEIFKICL
jgi:alcohol dehydrogenase YqhD (iron-dependent ADH family)